MKLNIVHYGARQVGKTYIIRELVKKKIISYIYQSILLCLFKLLIIIYIEDIYEKNIYYNYCIF